ncbi:MAG: enoyl-CoA hydratase/isomerase family protein [Phycisphaerae bacterium]|nr:enoyl-CoA hydratase/isomerase family protein [Phycisphaerae bacterium]
MIRIERHTDPRYAPVAEIILDRPEKRNALTPSMLTDLSARALELAANPTVRAILLRGEGAVFCSGFDLTLCKDNSDALADMLRALSTAIRTLRRIDKPIVIAARGAAIAGGCALLGGADLVIADQECKLGYPVLRLGISPAVNAPSLMLALGSRATRERLLDPQLIRGEEALRIGLIDRMVDIPEDVVPRAQIEAVKLAEKPPQAFAATKKWLNEVDGSDRDTPFEMALAASLALVGGDEERQRLNAQFNPNRG